MNLAAGRSARLREDFVIRLGCFLVSFAVLASLVLEPPRAKAFAMTSSAVTALAGGFLNACGLAPVVSGMSSSGEVNESLARLIQEYLTAEVPGVEIVDWLGDLSLKVNSGNKLVIPAAAAGALSAFAQWVAGKYGTQAGMNVVYSSQSVTFADGSIYQLAVLGKQSSTSSEHFDFYSSQAGTPIEFGSESNSTSIELLPNKTALFRNIPFQGSLRASVYSPYYEKWFDNIADLSSKICVCFVLRNSRLCTCFVDSDFDAYSFYASPYLLSESDTKSLLFLSSGLSLEVSDIMQEVLNRLTALEEGQSIALDVGATQSMEIQEILQGILDAILAGDLAASAEIVDEATEPVDPDPPVVPVVPEGLDKLGAALTSRFPFSIPWDVYKGVTLLAAPPKAPYFEVDFMAPIADRVGGWKGSTKIVLDFSEYEIIGQVCRWTSTIGFCLMLAVGTKRLIWTA